MNPQSDFRSIRVLERPQRAIEQAVSSYICPEPDRPSSVVAREARLLCLRGSRSTITLQEPAHPAVIELGCKTSGRIRAVSSNRDPSSCHAR
jgi:hypothetical protein